MPYAEAKRIAREKLLGLSKTLAAVASKGSIKSSQVTKAVSKTTPSQRDRNQRNIFENKTHTGSNSNIHQQQL